MPFLTTSTTGSGTLYTFAAGQFVYLVEGVNYLQSGGAGPTFLMAVSNVNFVVGGSIRSDAVALGVYNSGYRTVEVTADGVISSTSARAILYDGDLDLFNDGLIQSFSSSAIASGVTSSRLNLTNAGTIRAGGGAAAISTGDLADRIINSGLIVGDVSLGDGGDLFDNRYGEIAGRIFGGLGNDEYIVNGSEEIVEYVGEGFDFVTAYVDYALPDHIENLRLMAGARVGTGNALNNTITGTGGGDTLYGGRGDDLIDGVAGNNTLYGGGGDDNLFARDDDDVAYGGGGNDGITLEGGSNRAFGEAGDDAISSGADDDYVDGGAGTDLLGYIQSTAGVTVNLATGAASGGWAEGDTVLRVENVAGSQFNDVLTGSTGANLFYGLGGADQLFGGNGDDRLEGGAGADVLDGGQGTDWAEYSLTSSGGVTVNLTTGLGAGGDAQGDTYVSIENVAGSSGADTITGNVYANVLRGGGGDDYLLGAQGNDTLEGGAGADRLRGGPGIDTLVYADVVVGVPRGWGVDQVEFFEDGIDKISFAGATGVSGMADLTITNQVGYVSILTAGGDEIRLMGFTGTVDATDFIFT